MENSSIEWCDHTFNFWRGCREVSPGCANCYARELSKRNPAVLGCWGKGATRVLAKPAYRRKPLRWNGDAAAGRFRECMVCGRRERRGWDGIGLTPCSTPGCLSLSETESRPVRPRVFCASLSDWLDDEVPIEWLVNLLEIVRRTPDLDWLMLTKRPQWWQNRIILARRHCIALGAFTTASWLTDWMIGNPPANVWLGTTVEDQARADERIPLLLSIPAKVRFLSCEPLLGPVSLRDPNAEFGDGSMADLTDAPEGWDFYSGLDWIICGGESGRKARFMNPGWALSLRDQATQAGVPFLFKQWGDFLPDTQNPAMTHATPLPRNYSGGIRVGKKAAGRLLDGREWNEVPGEAALA